MFSSAVEGDGRHNSCWQFFFGRKRGVGIKDDTMCICIREIWYKALTLSTEQSMCAICLEAIDRLQKGSVPKAQLLQWFGQTELQRGQYQFAWATACKLDKLWSAEGINATVLKGRAISQYYAVPHHRYSCDLDVFIGQGWERACELLEGRGVELGRRGAAEGDQCRFGVGEETKI